MLTHRCAGPAVAAVMLSAVAMPQEPPPTNRLGAETSPYLRQHRDQPVAWQPWDAEALARARREQKPIFLSIGYSACHWCHVMAAESFADAATARLLNEHFVCIKVDREERPDLDDLYLTAVQAMGSAGGWPLSVWLTPDGQPFYGGTYFPPEDSAGRPAFRRVCQTLAGAWRDRRQELLAGAAELTTHLAAVLAPVLAPGEPSAALLPKVLAQASERVDSTFGGFGQPPHYAPKFPHATELRALLRLGEPAATAIAVAALRAMARGGICDQLGGGFHRYSTDREWLVPHFEKMLYDNALLASCYLEAHLATGDPEFAAVGKATLDYLLRELAAPGGGFHASQDAQSDGGEGRFYVWTKAEFDQVAADDAALLARIYGVTAGGNWEGRNVLAMVEDPPDDPGAAARFAAARARLFAARQRRSPPATDDKVLAAWNGFALTAFAHGFRVVGDERYREAAQQTASLLVAALVDRGRVARSQQAGQARHRGLLEDHAGLADGLLSVFEIDGDPRWLRAAHEVLAGLVQHFDAGDGGLWTTADDHESLIARSRIAVESATPSGAALAAHALLRAGLLFGDGALYDRGIDVLRANHDLLAASPAACPGLVLALWFHVGGPREIVVAGAADDPRTAALLRAAWRRFPAPAVVVRIDADNRAALEELSPVFRGKHPIDGVPAAYVCERGVCHAPATDPAVVGTGR